MDRGWKTGNHRAVARCLMEIGCSPHVVGAGIGARHADGCTAADPVLTVLVSREIPEDRLRAAVSRCAGKETPFEILEVGEVVALGGSGPRRS